MSQFILPTLLSALRRVAGLSQSELAHKLSVTPSAVHQAENPLHPIKEELFSRYAQAFGYASELDALEQGINLIRVEERKRAQQEEIARTVQAPRKRMAKKAAPAQASRQRIPRARAAKRQPPVPLL